MNWRHELGNLKEDAGAVLRCFFTSLKHGARKGADALRDSLQDTANRAKEKARNTKRKGGYK